MIIQPYYSRSHTGIKTPQLDGERDREREGGRVYCTLFTGDGCSSSVLKGGYQVLVAAFLMSNMLSCIVEESVGHLDGHFHLKSKMDTQYTVGKLNSY